MTNINYSRRLFIANPGRVSKNIPILMIAGGKGWGNAQDAKYLSSNFPKASRFDLRIWKRRFPPLFCSGIVHFYSRYELLSSPWPVPFSFYGASGLTWFHGNPADNNSEFGRMGRNLIKYLPKLDFITTSCNITSERLVSWGVPRAKVRIIPLGVDLEAFRPPQEGEKHSARKVLGIPNDSFCIASFQKDGNGWGEGLEPKLIKGPDVFLDTISRLPKGLPVFVILTGPARGYVKRGLEKINVKYVHAFPEKHSDLLTYYHASDSLLIASRDEGGPLALLEALATKTPVVSTKVGMAPDLINNGQNGSLAEICDPDGLAKCLTKVFEDRNWANQMAERGLATIQGYGWKSIASRFIKEVYDKCPV